MDQHIEGTLKYYLAYQIYWHPLELCSSLPHLTLVLLLTQGTPK